ncbi:MAG: hypothetical protein E6Q97_19625 [Desulfurellales bacterium]|nr:MAG: hypothetical protein E6Q97_19625 [Desulfurellales bacterium]
MYNQNMEEDEQHVELDDHERMFLAPEQLAVIRPEPRKGKKAPYRALTIPERDTLFSYFEKHHGNMLAMTRDHLCQFHSHAQLRYYCHLYNFHPRLVEIRRKQAEETLTGLKDSKLLAVQQAIEMLKPRQVLVRDKQDNVILDRDGQPVFTTIHPDKAEIKTAWEIIKTELGEPTTISKADVHKHEDDRIRDTLDAIAKLTEHERPQDNRSAVQGERGAAGDTAEVSSTIPNNPETQPSA